ncbi:MAG: magnesium transporter CorA family protein [Eggerthellaceae bacterium]|nr:magnesium transporter CorA family protein [Eggerthellaceae bacterium]
MIEFFRTDETTRSLVKLDEEESGCWIALFEPTDAEIAAIAHRFSIKEEDLRAPLDLEEVSRVEANDSYTMFIVDTPVRSHAKAPYGYETIPFAVFETPHHVISVCSRYHVPIISVLKSERDLFDTFQVKEFTSDLLMASSTAYFRALHSLDRRRKEVSADTTKPTRHDLEELYILDESFVYFTTSLATNDTAFERYRRYVLLGCRKEVREVFDDVALENRQALETTRIYSDILDSTIDHFDRILSYDLNRTMQLVATITLVLCVPTVVGGLFGMNLAGVPFADSPYGFAIVTGITAILLVLLLLLLKRLKWF